MYGSKTIALDLYFSLKYSVVTLVRTFLKESRRSHIGIETCRDILGNNELTFLDIHNDSRYPQRYIFEFSPFLFRLSVNAVDSGGRFATAAVNINVTDSNNNAPKFENTPYVVDVFEDTDIGSTVLMLFASDLDSGQNAKINYRLETPNEVFKVERDTGALGMLLFSHKITIFVQKHQNLIFHRTV